MMSINRDKINAVRADIRATAKKMLSGDTSYIAGARKIVALSYEARVDEHEEWLLPFIGIDSETDTIPIDDERDQWAKSALQKHAEEWLKAERWAENLGRDACERVLNETTLEPMRFP